jgi:hypothetical protein
MWKVTGVCIALLCTAGCAQPPKDPSSEQEVGIPSPTPATSRIPAFSGTRAYEYLKAQTAFGPRSPNSPGHAACLSYLVSTLKGFADQVRLQEFVQEGYDGEKLRLTNIVASYKPDAPARLLLCAHWDSRPRAEYDENRSRRNEPIHGANDGASGVGVLLELARLLKETPPSVGVDLVLFDGEDYGKNGDHALYLIGSRYFARNKPVDYLPRFGILLDMVGDAFLDLPKEANSVKFAPDIVSMVWNTARELGISQFLEEKGEEILDDHIPLNEAGIKTIDIIDFNYPDDTNRYWHTHQDTPEHCSPESLGAVGTVITHVVYRQTL